MMGDRAEACIDMSVTEVLIPILRLSSIVDGPRCHQVIANHDLWELERVSFSFLFICPVLCGLGLLSLLAIFVVNGL